MQLPICGEAGLQTGQVKLCEFFSTRAGMSWNTPTVLITRCSCLQVAPICRASCSSALSSRASQSMRIRRRPCSWESASSSLLWVAWRETANTCTTSSR
jgi:hypothetical protein